MSALNMRNELVTVALGWWPAVSGVLRMCFITSSTRLLTASRFAVTHSLKKACNVQRAVVVLHCLHHFPSCVAHAWMVCSLSEQPQ